MKGQQPLGSIVKKTVLITGANGFIGRFLSNYLIQNNYSIFNALRSPDSISNALADGRLVFL